MGGAAAERLINMDNKIPKVATVFTPMPGRCYPVIGKALEFR